MLVIYEKFQKKYIYFGDFYILSTEDADNSKDFY